MIPLSLAERGFLPDGLVRYGIRERLSKVRKRLNTSQGPQLEQAKSAFVRNLGKSEIALEQERVNEQHYELPPEFFGVFLGSRRKYSCCYWPEGVNDLDTSEEAMLKLTAFRAEIENGQHILELGCGWGSFSLWAAENYPDCRIHALSNSRSQVDFINSLAVSKGLTNLTAERADVLRYDTDKDYDRVVSIEMFEHMRNWRDLFGKIAGWLRPGGKCFLHFFCHRKVPYLFEHGAPSDWMGYYFFAGGMMPSFDLPGYFEGDLSVKRSWPVKGIHYVKTLEAWLSRMDSGKGMLIPVLEKIYGHEGKIWQSRWRIFLMACSELFGTLDGTEWMVAHHLLQRKE